MFSRIQTALTPAASSTLPHQSGAPVAPPTRTLAASPGVTEEIEGLVDRLSHSSLPNSSGLVHALTVAADRNRPSNLYKILKEAEKDLRLMEKKSAADKIEAGNIRSLVIEILQKWLFPLENLLFHDLNLPNSERQSVSFMLNNFVKTFGHPDNSKDKFTLLSNAIKQESGREWVEGATQTQLRAELNSWLSNSDRGKHAGTVIAVQALIGALTPISQDQALTPPVSRDSGPVLPRNPLLADGGEGPSSASIIYRA